MRQTALLSAGILFIAASLLSFAVEGKNWANVQTGDVVTFLLPADAEQPDPASAEDKLIITGGKILDIDIATLACGAGVRPVQHYALVDPTGKRAPKEGGIIIVSHEDPIRPGTSLSDPSFDTTCIAPSGTLYNRYVALVE